MKTMSYQGRHLYRKVPRYVPSGHARNAAAAMRPAVSVRRTASVLRTLAYAAAYVAAAAIVPLAFAVRSGRIGILAFVVSAMIAIAASALLGRIGQELERLIRTMDARIRRVRKNAVERHPEYEKYAPDGAPDAFFPYFS